MSEQSGQERTEDATPKRKEDSRKKGQVPRSKEFNTLISLLSAGVGMLIFGREIIDDIILLLRDHLSFGYATALNEASMSAALLDACISTLVLLSPLFILLLCTALLAPISLGGWVFSASQFAPKAERISPIKGLGRIFSVKSLVELVKAIFKFIAVASVTVYVIMLALDDIFAMPLLPMEQVFGTTGTLFIWCFLGFSSVLIVVAMLDIPYQIWDFNRQLKMTKQEIKDEMKETNGKPEIKSAIREKQQEFARQRMMTQVPTADVIITNPTHYAVALRYEQFGVGAPKVVAKGKGLIAKNIRGIAEEHGIALFSAPPLARALYASTEINQEIPGNLFLAVAQVLAYIFQLQKIKSHTRVKPKAPKNLPIPAEYQDVINKQFNSSANSSFNSSDQYRGNS
ncbi:MAG: flagellar biosynthesis protein FlhB [SAR86 cluster bacterium]|uniref:Flagellar biosynthetic protein FlhB n=1 Tax=SAR86 cluster bacterium TaxID=2030880 RepID=A0A2A5CAF4_9GAMM|nr:MAG: flagellar biosynthesis protein FlhB [SAR86 cluster bacterium]